MAKPDPLGLLHCCVERFLVSCKDDDHALYKAIGFMFPIQDSEQPPQALVLDYLDYPLHIDKQSQV